MKVLIASGGSGGHIFPAVSLAKELEKDNIEIIFVASRRRLDRNVLENATYKKIFLSANPMPYKFSWRVFIFLVKLFLDSVYALYLLLKVRPDIVIGFGGYTAGSIVLLATAMNIKTIIHEQNVVPGRTNKFLDKFVREIAVSFKETKKHFRNKNVMVTGNPLREESISECRPEAIGKFGFDKEKLAILVMGGSQGARSLNDLVSRSLNLLPYERKKNLQVIHITGQADFEKFKDFYKKTGIAGRVFSFVENINEAYSICDLAISRSGAAAILELAALAKPMILIPYPSQKNNQRFNAMFFAERNAAIYKDEKNLKPEELENIILELIDNPEKRKALSENARKLSVVDGAERLKKCIEGVWEKVS